jgi:uncharacterized protein with GYD domain
MATYISLVNYTDQGIRNIKDSPKRLAEVKKLAKAFGGNLKQFFLTMGGYDIVVVVDLPGDEAAAKFVLTIGAAGNVRTTTLKAFSESEYRKIIAALPG